MSNDRAIEYNAKLMEVRRTIERIKKINFNVFDIEQVIENINLKVEQEIKENNNNFKMVEIDTFYIDSLNATYSKAIAKLDKINKKLLKDYDTYSVIYSSYKYLDSKLKDITYDNLNEYLEEAKKILEMIRTSSTMDYKIEENLVYNVYELIYKVIKLELIYSRNDSLLKQVKADKTDATYIFKLINNEISSLERESQNEEIVRKIQELEREGLDKSYLIDSNLIILLMLSNNDSLIKNIKEGFLEQIDLINDERRVFQNKEKLRNITLEDNDNLDAERKELFKKALRKRILLVLNIAMLSGCYVASFIGGRELTKTKVYKTVTETYDSSVGLLEPSEEYREAQELDVSMTEYSPWEKPGYFRDEYKRNVYEYNLSDLDIFYEELEDYLNSNLKDTLTIVEDTETAEKLPKKDDYKENKYVITKTYQDKGDFKIKNRPVYWGLFTILTSFGITAVDLLLLKKLQKNTIKELKLRRRNIKGKMIENDDSIETLNDEIEKLESKIGCLENKLQLDYEKLPNVLQEDEKIKTKILELKSK